LVAGLLVLVLCPVYFAPLREHTAGYHERDEALAAAAILVDLTPPGPAAAEDGRRRHSVALPGAPIIELNRVTVAFTDTHPPVLNDISIRLPAGMLMVLAAPSGEGTTAPKQYPSSLTTGKPWHRHRRWRTTRDRTSTRRRAALTQPGCAVSATATRT
jgi:ATP-binding cassette subfamily C protein CydD